MDTASSIRLTGYSEAMQVSEWMQRLATAQKLQQTLDAVLSTFGLTLRDFELLRCLPGRVLSQTAIVGKLGTSKVFVSRSVRRLRDEGFLDVTEAQGDKRATRVALTEQGAERLCEAEASVDEFLTELGRALDGEGSPLPAVGAALCRIPAVDGPYHTARRD